jgi:hypothetical protein
VDKIKNKDVTAHAVYVYTVNESIAPIILNSSTPSDLKKLRPVSPLKIKIPSNNMCEKPTNATIIHSVY